MVFSLKKAEQLSPKRIRNMMVRDIDNLSDPRSFVAEDIMPLYRMGNINEVYHKISGTRLAMPGADLNGEPEVRSLNAPEEQGMEIHTFKERVSPERFVDGQVNSEGEIVNIANLVNKALRHDLRASRELAVFHGYNGTTGLIGSDGMTAHPGLSTQHVIAPGSGRYSDTANSDPHGDIMYGRGRLNIDGDAFDELGNMVLWASAESIMNLLMNDNLEDRFSGIQANTPDSASELTSVLPVDEVREVRTKLPRTNDFGQPIDEAGNVVDDPENAAKDNILDPWNDAAGEPVRNMILTYPGEASGCMPWMIDRLAEHAEDAPGEAIIDPTNGYMLRRYTETVTMTHWEEMDQEIGTHLTRPQNWVVYQDV